MNKIPALWIFLALSVPLSLVAGGDAAEDTPNCPARVSFLELRDGDTVNETFLVQFVSSDFEIVPAGTERANAGHHHLLIDVDVLPSLDQPLPATDNIRHFGGGQTSTLVTLPPGDHTLQLILGDHIHVPHNPPVMSPKIHITVVEDVVEEEETVED
jgi:hypothetical protein